MNHLIGSPISALAQATKDPTISLQVSGLDATEPWTFGLRILFMLTVLTLAPALLMLVTSFTRVVIVLGLLRQALLTLFIMMPVWEQVRTEALNPFLENQVTQEVAMQRAIEPIREFMLKQVREKDLGLFMSMGKIPDPQTAKDVPIHVLVPAFVTSELRTAFQIGFLIYVPFLVIDMIVASTLMSMGMMMLPPIMISLPFKLVLFVLADGWFLVVGSLMNSFQ
jgi:flagellar biosynthetic protein FliP